MEDTTQIDLLKAIEDIGRYIDNDMDARERKIFEKVLACEPKLNELHGKLLKQKAILKYILQDVKG